MAILYKKMKVLIFISQMAIPIMLCYKQILGKAALSYWERGCYPERQGLKLD